MQVLLEQLLAFDPQLISGVPPAVLRLSRRPLGHSAGDHLQAPTPRNFAGHALDEGLQRHPYFIDMPKLFMVRDYCRGFLVNQLDIDW